MPTSSPPVYNGRYELSHQIARGGTAQVYLARDLLLDRPVALKMLFPELSTDRTFVDRFRREAQAAANLSHPNIVPVFDWGESDRTYYIVMEYVDGEPLSAIIRTQAPLDGAQAAGIAADIAKALSYAHRHGVVHRDIKPGNVLITSDGQVKVTDFGIARAIGSDENVTQTGLVMGTATYFSPEQAQGLGVDGRSDVYSLGVVLFEMLTGRPPFSGETPVSIAYQHVREPAPTPRSINPSIPLTLEALVLQAMAKQPSERYQTAQDFQADLQRWVQGGTVIVPTQDLGRAPRDPVSGGATGNGAVVAPDSGGAGLTTALPADHGATSVLGATAAASGAAAATTAGAVATRPAAATTSFATAAGAPPSAPTAITTAEARRIEGKPPLPKRRTLEWAAAAVALIVAMGLVAVLGGRALGYFGGKTYTNVPNFTELSLNAAKVAIAADGFKFGTYTQRFDSTNAGTVIGQSPTEGTQVQQGVVIDLVVSKGPQSNNVPGVSGLLASTAEADLRNAGFKVSVSYSSLPAGSTLQQGDVMSQSPQGGTLEKEGSVVSIVIARGISDIKVPAIPQGDSQTAATLALTNVGLTHITTMPQPSFTVASGSVISTNPPAGTLVAPTATITLVISTGAPVNVPNVVGETQADATKALEGLLFVVNPVQVTDCNQTQNGTVLSTTPLGNTSQPQGSTVTIDVANFASTCPTTSTSSTSSTVPTSSTTGTTGTGTA